MQLVFAYSDLHEDTGTRLTCFLTPQGNTPTCSSSASLAPPLSLASGPHNLVSPALRALEASGPSGPIHYSACQILADLIQLFLLCKLSSY
jgi:hypothetical protein